MGVVVGGEEHIRGWAVLLLPHLLLLLSRGGVNLVVCGHLLQVVPGLASGVAQRVAWHLRLASGVTQRDGR